MKEINIQNLVTKEELENYYLKENHTQAECFKHFNVTSWIWGKLINYYNIKKPVSKRLKNIRSTNIKKYGCEYVSQNKCIKDRIQKTKQNKTSEEKNIIKEKRKATNIKKYGVSTYSQLDECKEKVKNTSLKKFGVDNISKSPEYLKKKRNTCLNKYGDENYTNKNKANITIQNKYGVNNFAELCKLEEIKEKKKLKVKEKYGVNYFTESFFNDYNKTYKILYHDKEKSIEYLVNNPKHTFEEWSDLFNCPLNSIYNWISRFHLWEYIKNTKSHYEEEIINIIKEIIPNEKIIHNNRKILGNGQELDIFIPKYKIGIEFNGDYWHSSLVLDKNYHFEKSKLAESKGIRLIHIWEYEWLDKIQRNKIIMLIKSSLNKNDNKVYARKCIIKQISNEEAKILNNKVHLQGHRGAQLTYGLFYKDKLVQLMSFSKTKYNRNLKSDSSWEIIRGCPGSNTNVIGGVGKLFKFFIKENKPTTIFSYCDFNKFNGVSYEKIGMKFVGYTGPDMKWLLKKGTVVNRNPKKHKEIKELSVAQLYGAGSKKYIWNNV